MSDLSKVQKHMLANPTRAYVASTSAQWWGIGSAVLDGTPFFTWFDIPRMLRDPQVQFGLRMLRSPFQQVKWTVRADTDRVARFVDITLKRFWRKSLPLVLDRYFKWGYCPAGVEYKQDQNKLKFDRLRIVEPPDAQVLVGTRDSTFKGFAVKNGTVECNVLSPHAFWFAGHGEYQKYYDRPRLAGGFEPWLEKNGRNGAKHSRRLYHWKHATRGARLYHPTGTQVINLPGGGTREVENADIATEIIEKTESGASMRLPNTLNPMDQTKYEWDLVEAESKTDGGGHLEYISALDNEIMIGLGIPPEVLEASEVGSGWSGRMIPAMAYYGSCDEIAGLMAEAADNMVIRKLVDVNFGPQRRYEIELKPLVETAFANEGGWKQDPKKPGGSERQNPSAGTGFNAYNAPNGIFGNNGKQERNVKGQ